MDRKIRTGNQLAVSFQIYEDLSQTLKTLGDGDSIDVAAYCEKIKCSDIEMLRGLADAIEQIRNETNGIDDDDSPSVYDFVIRFSEIWMHPGLLRNCRTGKDMTREEWIGPRN